MTKIKTVVALVAAFFMWGSAALAAQGSGCMPTSGTVSGLTLVQDINAGIAALISSNSGATAPATDCTAVAVKGQLWLDTSGTPNILKIYDGANWLALGAVDTSGHLWKPPVGGGSETLASATTTDLCSVAGSYVSITGTTTITGFSNTCVAGTMKFVSFVSTPIVTYNGTSLILPGAASITAQAGDAALFVYLGGSNWKAVAWTRADGTSISFSAVFTGGVFFDSPISATVSTNTNNWAPTGIATANVIRLNCSVASNITGMSSPATDGQIIVIDSLLTSAATCTLTSQDSNSTAANRFGFDRPISIRPGRSLTVKYDSNASRWRLTQEVTSQPIAGGSKNLRVFNVATYFGDSAPSVPNSQMSVAADELTVEDSSGGAARLSSVAIPTIDVTASGANGLDTGSVANSTWYSVWVIYNPTTSTTAGLFSTSATAPTMPSGYTFKARVGWNLTDGSSHFNRIIKYGLRSQYIVSSVVTTQLPEIGNTTSSTYVAKSISAFVPVTAATIYLSGTLSTTSTASIAPNNVYAAGSLTAPPPLLITSQSGSGSIIIETSNIYMATVGGTVRVFAAGWDDTQ